MVTCKCIKGVYYTVCDIWLTKLKGTLIVIKIQKFLSSNV